MSDYYIEEVASGVFARLGRGPIQPNCAFIVGDEGVIVFDSSYSPVAGRAIADDIRHVTPKPIQILVVSHHHWDHAWGAQAFGTAQIVAHVGARHALITRADLQLNSLRQQPDRPAGWMGISPHQLVSELDELRISLPTLTYSEAVTLWCGGREIQLRHFGPAHTYGDTLLWLPQDRLLFGGDVVCNRLIPVVGDGDPFHFLQVLDTVRGLNAQIIVPGHGKLAGASELNDFAACLRALCDEVAIAKANGARDAAGALERIRLSAFDGWAGRDILPGSVRRIWELLATATRNDL